MVIVHWKYEKCCIPEGFLFVHGALLLFSSRCSAGFSFASGLLSLSLSPFICTPSHFSPSTMGILSVMSVMDKARACHGQGHFNCPSKRMAKG